MAQPNCLHLLTNSTVSHGTVMPRARCIDCCHPDQPIRGKGEDAFDETTIFPSIEKWILLCPVGWLLNRYFNAVRCCPHSLLSHHWILGANCIDKGLDVFSSGSIDLCGGGVLENAQQTTPSKSKPFMHGGSIHSKC